MNIYTPFTYCITFIPTGRRYYGARYANNKKEVAHPDQLWTTYFTSSKIIKDLIDYYGEDSFTFEVRKIFKTRAEALSWENKFLTKINATKHPEWLNDHNGGHNFHPTPESIQKSLDTKKKNGTGSGSQNVIQKRKDTLKERGIEHNMKNPETVQKVKDTRLKNGTLNPNTPESIQKCKDTKKKNGTPQPSTIPFLSIIKTKKTYAKNQISRLFPNLKKYY